METLKKLGQECQLHGFFNCTFIWSKTTRTHWLFEADPRPNPWHQFGPRLGVDWIELMRFPSATVVGPTLPRHPTILGLYPRTIIAFGLSKNVTIILPWLLGLPGTWRTRNTRDAAINAMEKAIVWESLGITKRRNRLRRFWSRLRARSGRDS